MAPLPSESPEPRFTSMSPSADSEVRCPSERDMALTCFSKEARFSSFLGKPSIRNRRCPLSFMACSRRLIVTCMQSRMIR